MLSKSEFKEQATKHNMLVLRQFVLDHSRAHASESDNRSDEVIDLLREYARDKRTTLHRVRNVLLQPSREIQNVKDLDMKRSVLRWLRNSTEWLENVTLRDVRALLRHRPRDVHGDDDILCAAGLCVRASSGSAGTRVLQRLAAHLWMATERITGATSIDAYGSLSGLPSMNFRKGLQEKDFAIIDREQLDEFASVVHVANARDENATVALLVSLDACHTFTELSDVITDAVTNLEDMSRRYEAARGNDTRASVTHMLGALVSNNVIHP